MGRKRKFSTEQDADIAKLYVDDRLTLKQLAEQLGVNRAVIRNSLLRSEIEMRPRSSPRPEYEWVRCACGKRASYKTGQCVRCYSQEYNQTPDGQARQRSWWLMAHYRLTRDAYDAMLASQDGVCAICLNPGPRRDKLAVDHDHACCPGADSCGKCVRGLLCVNCNRAVGLLKDDVASARRLLSYLDRAHAGYTEMLKTAVTAAPTGVAQRMVNVPPVTVWEPPK
jgi:transposase-like protein